MNSATVRFQVGPKAAGMPTYRQGWRYTLDISAFRPPSSTSVLGKGCPYSSELSFARASRSTYDILPVYHILVQIRNTFYSTGVERLRP